MSPTDERELHRICALLEVLDKSLPTDSPLREGLLKAGWALHIAFIDGRRKWIEDSHASSERGLTDEQRERLLSLGIDPDAD